MSNALNRCRLVNGWQKQFLAAIRNGYAEINAANMSGIGSDTVRRRVEQDPIFATEYATAVEERRPRFVVDRRK